MILTIIVSAAASIRKKQGSEEMRWNKTSWRISGESARTVCVYMRARGSKAKFKAVESGRVWRVRRRQRSNEVKWRRPDRSVILPSAAAPADGSAQGPNHCSHWHQTQQSRFKSKMTVLRLCSYMWNVQMKCKCKRVHRDWASMCFLLVLPLSLSAWWVKG